MTRWNEGCSVLLHGRTASGLRRSELFRFHQPGGFSLSIVGPRAHRSQITLDNPRDRYARPVVPQSPTRSRGNMSKVVSERGTGGATFAAILMILGGGFGLLEGISLIAKGTFYV